MTNVHIERRNQMSYHKGWVVIILAAKNSQQTVKSLKNTTARHSKHCMYLI